MADERIQPITMPKWGMIMTEGKISAWLKQEGETVEGDRDASVVFKADSEMYSITNDKWNETAPLEKKKRSASACILNN